MKDNVENIFKNADFSKGSNHKEELRKKLNNKDNKTARVLQFKQNQELSDDELEMISAAGLYEDHYKDDKDDNK